LLIASLNGYAQPKIGEQVQEIALKNAKGETEKLSDLRGKVSADRFLGILVWPLPPFQ
jgi:hypothetical protein